MIWFMEELLRLEADIKHFVGIKDHSYQRWLMDELQKILKEAEFLFGPRDRSYELLEPRITDRALGPYWLKWLVLSLILREFYVPTSKRMAEALQGGALPFSKVSKASF